MADIHMPHVASGSKIGGHSVWLWGGVLAGVVVIYVYYSRSKSGATAVAPALTTTDGSLMGDTGSGGASLPSSGALPVSSGGSGSSGAVDSTGGTDTSSSGGTGGTGIDPTTGLPLDPTTGLPFSDAPPPDNFTWEGTAVAYLISHGVSGIHAQQAIEKYLNGDTLTYQEATWMNGVIASNGIAPDGVNATPSYLPKPKPHIAKPKPKPHVTKPKPHVTKPKPTAHHTTTVKHPAGTHHTVVKHPAQTKHTGAKPKPKVTIRRKR